MKRSRSLIYILLPLIYLWMVSSIAANTADCVDCRVDSDPTVRPTTGNARELASLPVEINELTQEIGCVSIQTNSDFDLLLSGLRSTGSNPEDFFRYAHCENIWADENDELPTISPYQLALIDPASRVLMIKNLLIYFDENLSDRSIVREILNHRDNKGRTMLDFLEHLYSTKYKNDESSRLMLDQLRREMCARGGQHTPQRDNCEPNTQYAGV